MNVYLIDWGENCNGARYAVIAGLDPSNLIFKIDCIGDPSSCKFCNLGEWLFEHEKQENYLELGTQKESYSHSLELAVKKMPWKNIIDLD